MEVINSLDLTDWARKRRIKELTIVFTNVKVIGNLQEQCPGRCGGIKVDQSAFNQEW